MMCDPDIDCVGLKPSNACIVPCPMPRHEPCPPENCNRQELLEWRICTQESTTVGLLEKLSLLKADMLEYMKQMKHMKNEQIIQREFFNDEIKDLGTAIAEINNEVRCFEENVREKWKAVNAAAVTLRNLENHHVTSLADVRRRIARNDQAIACINEKLGQLADELCSLSNTHKEDVMEIHCKLKELQDKITVLQHHLDQAVAKLCANIKAVEDQLRAMIADLECRMQCNVDKLTEEIRENAVQFNACLQKLEEQLTAMVKCHVADLQARIQAVHEEALKLKIDECLTKRVADLESDTAEFKCQVQRSFKEMEMRICKVSEQMCESQRCANELIREEMRQGFYTMHDTVNNLKSMLENKLRISEETLQLEINQLRKLIVLT